jgi:chromosome segregation ATPase
MPATVEKVLGAKRSRLARIDEGIEAREAKLAETRREIVELAGREQEAAAEALRRDPSKSAYALRSPAHELKRKRLELEKSVSVLEQELALLNSDRVAADAEQAARELGERTNEGRNLTQKEREARSACAKTFVQLVERWGALAEVLEQRSELRSTVAGERLIERLGIFDREAREAWDAVADYLVEPVAVDLRGLIDEFFESVLGARPEDDAEGLAELNRHRARYALAAEVRTIP